MPKRPAYKHLNRYRDRHGKMRTYYRIKGHPQIELPDPSDPTFPQAYAAVHASFQRQQAPIPDYGTVAWLVDTYRASDEFKALSESTQINSYGRNLDLIRANFGANNWAEVDTPWFYHFRDQNAEARHQTNMCLALFSILGQVAVRYGVRRDNPAWRIKKLKGGREYEPWTPEELQVAYDSDLPPAIRTLVMLCHYTGQRVGDVLRMTRADIKDGLIRVVPDKQRQGKEDALWVPIHTDLAEYIATLPANGLALVARADGKPYTQSGINAIWQRLKKAVGLKSVQLHGLRKNAAIMLAEAGCTDAEIMAILGWTTVSMVRHYTKSVRKKAMARNAARKMGAASGTVVELGTEKSS